MKKTKKPTRKKGTPELGKKLWGEINTLKSELSMAKGKIHNLNGDTATLFDRTKHLQNGATKKWYNPLTWLGLC